MKKKSPFKFLDSYDKNDIDEFFGRDRETKALFQKTFASNLILLYGLSGTGKTSLVRCGLHNMFADSDWLPLFIRHNDNLIKSLTEAIYDTAHEKDLLEGKPIREQIESLYLDFYKPVFLIFDQFEELFIFGEEKEADRFFWLLSELMQAKLQVKVILIMREEYLAHLDRFEKIVPGLFENRFRVERMREGDLREVIVKSAAQFDIELVEPQAALADQILNNIRHERGWIELAYLQLYLDRLYQDDKQRRGQDDRPIRFDEALLNKTGKLKDVLARFLDDQLKSINQDMEQRGAKAEDAALKILAQLVTNQATKQPRMIGPVIESLTAEKELSAEDVAFCIDRLEKMGIIRYL